MGRKILNLMALLIPIFFYNGMGAAGNRRRPLDTD